MAAMQCQKTQLLLVNKLLNLRDGISPFNIIFDSLEQSSKPIIIEYARRANVSETKLIYVSFESIKNPFETAHFVDARGNTLLGIQCHLRETIQSKYSEHAQFFENLIGLFLKLSEYLVIVDSVASIISNTLNVSEFFSSFITENVSIVAVFHSPLLIGTLELNEHYPATVALLNYLATTTVTVHSLCQAVIKHNAAQSGKFDPIFGVQEEIEGVIVGRGANSSYGTLVEVEHRRKSGRSVGLRFVLETPIHSREGWGMITLAHEYFKIETPDKGDMTTRTNSAGGTFNLELTKKQRDAREGVVLPYFDAQTGNNEGGKILYDLGKEDDFDEEEDEI